MPLDETEIKTRLGLILEDVVEEALERATYNFAKDYQYDETCEVPDFLIPNEKKPRYMIELHQTEARNSFQMKTLRAFMAVTEAKAQYGDNLISVNILFGDPENELPGSNVQAMCGVFDSNLLPRRDSKNPKLISKLEAAALKLAKDENIKTDQASVRLVKDQSPGVDEISRCVSACLKSASPKTTLNQLWALERKRLRSLGMPPKAGLATYYKRVMLKALYLKDDDFAELYAKKDPGNCSASVRQQLVSTGIATLVEELDGDHYNLDPQFQLFLRDPDAPRLRQMCKRVLDTVPEMKWFFEDIRDSKRRLNMAKSFLQVLSGGTKRFASAFSLSFDGGTSLGVTHTRCWIADLIPICVKKSHNYFNIQIRRHPKCPSSLGNPFNNITIRSARLGKSAKVLNAYKALTLEVFFKLLTTENIAPSQVDARWVADELLRLRIGAAIKLQRLNPLLLVAASVCTQLGIVIEKITARSAVGDVSGDPTVGDFKPLRLTAAQGGLAILFNAVAVHDKHGDDKSKEWGARRLATLYRVEDEVVRPSEYQNGIFVIDGEWEDKHVARLYRSGWNHVVRLGDLEKTLRRIFKIKGELKSVPQKPTPLRHKGEIDLPLAAEDDVPERLDEE